MKQRLIDTLATLGFIPGQSLFLQGTMNPEEPYPESFLTFWTDYTDDNGHFDNEVLSVDWHFSLIFYASNPTIVNTKPADIITALRAAGFIPQGRGQDIPSDEPTHTGWAMDFIITETLITQ